MQLILVELNSRQKFKIFKVVGKEFKIERNSSCCNNGIGD